MRAVLVLAVLVVIVALCLSLRRGPARVTRRRTGVFRDELVKDPVCQTYVVRSRAVAARGGDGAPYFCSVDCARRYSG